MRRVSASIPHSIRYQRTRRQPSPSAAHSRLKGAGQPSKGFLIRIMVLPNAEVRDEEFPNLTGRIFAGIRVEMLLILQLLNFDKGHCKEDAALFFNFRLRAFCDFCLYPTTLHAVFGRGSGVSRILGCYTTVGRTSLGGFASVQRAFQSALSISQSSVPGGISIIGL